MGRRHYVVQREDGLTVCGDYQQPGQDEPELGQLLEQQGCSDPPPRWTRDALWRVVDIDVDEHSSDASDNTLVVESTADY